MNSPHLQTLVKHFADQLSGEPIPDFRSEEANRVVAGATAAREIAIIRDKGGELC